MRCLFSVACVLLVACGPSEESVVAIAGITVVDVQNGSLQAAQTVLIEGNRIAAVGPTGSTSIPANAVVVDGSDDFLIPGLWDTHVHSLSRADWHFPLFLAHGVTAVRDMNVGSDSALAVVRAVRGDLASGELLGPRFLAAGSSIDGDPPLSEAPLMPRTAEEARDAVDQLAGGGADLIKVYENLSREAYFAIVDQARERSLPVDGHVPFRVSPIEAADAGQRTVEHLLGMAWGCARDAEVERQDFTRVMESYASGSDLGAGLAEIRHEQTLYEMRDPAFCDSTIEAYLRNGVASTPTLVAFQTIVALEAGRGGLGLVPEAVGDDWEALIETDMGEALRASMRPQLAGQGDNTRLLSEAGVVLLSGTDVGVPMLVPGWSLHDELAHLVSAGLSPLSALQAATVNPAEVFGLSDSLGVIAEGMLADMVVLDANPLADIRNTRRIEAVVVGGRLMEGADLRRLLAEARAWRFSER